MGEVPERLEFRYSRQGQLALITISLLLVASSLFMAATTADIVYRTVGWLGVGFFILCALIALRRLVQGGAPFVFEHAGIAFPAGNFGLLPWSEVKEYSVVTVRGNEFLALTFHDPERVLSRVSRTKHRWALANKRLGWGHWALSFYGLTPGISQAIGYIQEHTSVTPAG